MFSVSKFKNSSPKIPKKDLICSELPISSNDITLGNSISCNLKNIYFSIGKGEVGVLAIGDTGRKNFSVPKIIASASCLVSIAATPLDSSLLATACETEGIKIWKNSSSGPPHHNLEVQIVPHNKETIRNIGFHPCSHEIVSSVGTSGFSVIDISRPDTSISSFDGAGMSSFSWKDDGSVAVCYEESGEFLISDPRQFSSCQKYKKSLKNPKVVWAGTTDYFMAFGSEKTSTSRAAFAWDVRNLTQEWSKKTIDSSTSVFYPCYDPDTGMIVLASRGSTSAHFFELEKNGFSPIRTDQYDCDSFGICSAPRNLLNVMSCEVMRIIQLGKSAITPISYHVTRKSYSSFYPELFPDATQKTSSITAAEWFHGSNKPLNRVSLNPFPQSEEETQNDSLSRENSKAHIENNTSFTRPAIFDNPETHSKFKNIVGTKLHQTFQHEMLVNLERKTAAEANGISVNFDTIAVPLVGASGKIGILKLSHPGRTPDSGMFYVENRSQVCDFELDKKNDNLLGVICEDSSINIWKLPPSGLQTNLLQSDIRFVLSNDRCTIMKFHPCASAILCTAGLDGCLRIWDIVKKTSINACNLPTRSQILATDWNEVGSQICCSASDKKIYILDPRSSGPPAFQGEGLEGTGPGRIIFVDEQTLLTSGFTSDGNRTIALKDIRNAKDFLVKTVLEKSPSVLIPHYDGDTKIVYLGGKGECSICPYEIRKDAVGLFVLPKYRSLEPHCGFSLLRKDVCNVRECEIAKIVRLVKSSTEIISFTVPRLRAQYFQDDIFPPTRKIWESSMTADDYIQKRDRLQGVFNLKPDDMKKLSETDLGPEKPKKYDSRLELGKFNSNTGEKEDFLDIVMDKIRGIDGNSSEEEKKGSSGSDWED